jgi:hypothetical protein
MNFGQVRVKIKKMKKVRILKVSFDTSIEPYQLPAFRAAIAHKVGLQHDWFHNHDNTKGQFHYRYPLIQYKLDTFKGQMRPMLFCLNNAVEAAQHFFEQLDWGIQIDTHFHHLSVGNLDACQHHLKVWSDAFFKYRLHKWQALNPDNYKIWKTLYLHVAF